MNLIHVLVLIDHLLIPSFQIAIVKELEDLWNSHKYPRRTKFIDHVSYVYENTMPGSPLRNLMIDQCAYELGHGKTFIDREDLPQEMLLDLVRVLGNGLSVHSWEKNSQGCHDKMRPIYKFKRVFRTYLVLEE
jgi:hypothetical protein